MVRVAELVGSTGTPPAPSTRPSRPQATGAGADRHVAVRSLAEQLVCEANAILQEGQRLTLTDEVVDGRLDFTVTYGDSSARVSTAFSGGRSQAQLLRDGSPDAVPVELQDADALPDLLLGLLSGASRV